MDKIVEKIQKDVTFAIIIAKLSIPFNLDIDEEKPRRLKEKEIKAQEHLEQMVEITKKIGFNDIKKEKAEEEITKTEEIEKQKERGE